MYQNNDNYVKVARVYNNGNQFQFGKEVAGAYTEQNVTDSITGTTVYLKITKSGNNYSGYYSADGTTYTQAGTTQSVTLKSFSRIWEIIDLLVFIVAGSGLYSFVWSKKIFNSAFWKVFFVLNLIWSTIGSESIVLNRN